MKLKVASIILALFLAAGTYAQVTINSHVDPESFSVVQVESDTSGVRLPRMTSAQMAALQTTLTSDDRAKGLVVYNETDKVLSYWDGASWASLFGTLATNGITATSPTTIELGGNLTEASTQIAQGSYDLNFAHSPATSGELTISNVKIDDDKVSIAPGSTFSVNDPAMNVSGGAVSMNTEGADFDANSGALIVRSARTLIQGSISYPHASREEDYILTSDAAGNASWAGLRPFGALKRGALNNSVRFDDGSDKDITSTALTLEPGKWIIFAKCTTVSTYRTSSSYKKGMYHWLKLRSYTTADTGFSNPQIETTSGINQELSTTNNQVIYSCPSLVHFIDINTTRVYRILISTSNTLGDSTTSSYGGSYFYAIRIDIPTP